MIRILQYTFIGIIAAEAFSFFSFLSPQMEPWLFGAVALAAIVFTVKKLEWGVLFLFVELIIGSFGRMLELSLGGFDVSLRMALWLIVLAAWAAHALRERRIRFFESKLLKPYLALGIVLAWGIAWGVIRGNPLGAVFSDTNNYLYFLLIFPVYHVFAVQPRDARFCVSTVAVAAFAWLSIKTIALFYIFSHELFGLQDVLYDWSRHAHLAEITNVDPTVILSRVFMQSQIWLVFGTFFLLGVLYMSLRGAPYSGRRGNPNVALDTTNQETASSWLLGLPRLGVPSLPMTVGLLVLSISAIIASFSRSFWLAMAITFVILVIALIVVMRIRLKAVSRFVAVAAGITVLAIGFTVGVMRFPIPPSQAPADLIVNRASKFSGEAAVSSRYAQIRPLLGAIQNHPVWGSGFGTAVTYQSQDPRVLKNNPDGWYATTAFELGWLELWLKIGLLGVGAYLYLLWRIVKLGWSQIVRHPEPQAKDLVNHAGASVTRFLGFARNDVLLGALAGLVAVALTHGVSPYLNHPLGIGVVMLVTVLVDREH